MECGHLAHMGRGKNVYNILIGKSYEGEHLEELGLWQGNIKIHLEKSNVKMWTKFT
jgi:hypothetical protein